MRRWRGMIALGALLALALMVNPVLGQQALKLKFATLSQGTAWYQYGATMAEMLTRTLPAGTTIDVLPHSGGTSPAMGDPAYGMIVRILPPRHRS